MSHARATLLSLKGAFRSGARHAPLRQGIGHRKLERGGACTRVRLAHETRLQYSRASTWSAGLHAAHPVLRRRVQRVAPTRLPVRRVQRPPSGQHKPSAIQSTNTPRLFRTRPFYQPPTFYHRRFVLPSQEDELINLKACGVYPTLGTTLICLNMI